MLDQLESPTWFRSYRWNLVLAANQDPLGLSAGGAGTLAPFAGVRASSWHGN